MEINREAPATAEGEIDIAAGAPSYLGVYSWPS
jgi:hypothetical protein